MKKIFTLMLTAFLVTNLWAGVFTAGQTVVFNTTNHSYWATSDAKLGAYFCNPDVDGAFAAEFADDITTGYWKISVPGDENKTWSHVILVRFNSNATEIRWNNGDDNVWDQTANLEAPTNDNNCFYLNNSGNGLSGWQTFLSFVGTPSVQYNSSTYPSPTVDLSWFASNHAAGTITYLNLGGGVKPNINPTGLTAKLKYRVLKGADPEPVTEQTINLTELQASGELTSAALDNVFSHFLPVSGATDYGVQFWYVIEYEGIPVPYSNLGANYKISFSIPTFQQKASTDLYIYQGATLATADWETSTAFDGQSLGSLSTLPLGGEIQLSGWLNPSDVEAYFNYQVKSSADESIVTPETSIPMQYVGNGVNNDDGNIDKWQTAAGTNVAAGLGAGEYKVEIWLSARSNTASGWNYYNKGGNDNNYSATFTITTTTSASVIAADQQVKSVDFYTVNGQKVTENYKGVIIKKTTYTDGQVKAEKVLVLK